jgi:signal transduction histidine kinase
MTRRFSWWLVPTVFFLAAGSVGANHGSTQAHLWLSAVLAAIGGLAVLLRTSSPLAMVVAGGLAATAYFALGLANGPIFLTVPLVAFLLAYDRPPRLWAPLLGLDVALVAIGLVLRGLRDDHSLSAGIWQACAIAAIGSGAAAIATTIGARREAVLERTQRAATEERLRMAQDLHDGVGHGLAVIAMQAGVALHVLDKDPDSARASLVAIRDTSRESLEALRAELSHLQPGDASSARAPRRGLDDLPVLVERVGAGGLAVTFESSAGTVDAALGETAYGVVQEALTNVLRHARADRAQVVVSRGDGALLVSVADDGQGGDVVEGMGLRGMRRRVELLGGMLSAGPVDGGFRVEARFPVGTP